MKEAADVDRGTDYRGEHQSKISADGSQCPGRNVGHSAVCLGRKVGQDVVSSRVLGVRDEPPVPEWSLTHPHASRSAHRVAYASDHVRPSMHPITYNYFVLAIFIAQMLHRTRVDGRGCCRCCQLPLHIAAQNNLHSCL